MAQDPSSASKDAAASEKSSGFSFKGMLNDAKKAAQDAAQSVSDAATKTKEEMEQYEKETADINNLMEMALKEMAAYEKRLNDLADDTEGKVNMLSQFARAKAVIYVHSIKVGLGLVGGAYGRGVLLSRSDAGWSLPFAVTKPEVKLGPQLSAVAEDSILLLSSEKSVKAFVTGKSSSLTVGLDAYYAFDDKGGNLSTNNTNVSSADQKGYGGGATIDFGTFNDFVEANKSFYGDDYDVSRILNISPSMEADIVKKLGAKLDSTKKFIETLEKFAVAATQEMGKSADK